jgi:hypothetical protein
LHESRRNPARRRTIRISKSFNGSFRDECLKMNWFMSLEDVGDKIER